MRHQWTADAEGFELAGQNDAARMLAGISRDRRARKLRRRRDWIRYGRNRNSRSCYRQAPGRTILGERAALTNSFHRKTESIRRRSDESLWRFAQLPAHH